MSTLTGQMFLRFLGLSCFTLAMLFAIVIIFGLARRKRPTCPSCGHENRPHARFCADCGQRIT